MKGKSYIILGITFVLFLVYFILETGVKPYRSGPYGTIKSEFVKSRKAIQDKVPIFDSNQISTYDWLGDESKKAVVDSVKSLKSADGTFQIITDPKFIGSKLPENRSPLSVFLVKRQGKWAKL